MKGWRPSAIRRLETGSGYFQEGVFLPDVGSIGLPFPRVLGPWAHHPGDRGRRVPAGSRNEASRPPSRTNGAQASAILEMAPALHLLQETGGRKRGPKERQTRQGRTSSAPAAAAPARPEGSSKKKGRWGSAQPLDKAEFGEGSSRI